MTTIKLYYKNIIGENNLEQEDIDPSLIWYFNKLTSIHNVFDSCGIEYEWTQDPNEGIVFLDFGSRTTNDLEQFVAKYSKMYNKCIVFSSQEPLVIADSSIDFLEKYTNVILLDSMLSVYDDYMPRHVGFPFFFVRMVNNYLNLLEPLPRLHINTYDKPYNFNNLKARWTQDKFLLHYELVKHRLEERNVVSYQPPKEVNASVINHVAKLLPKGFDEDWIGQLKTLPAMTLEEDNLERVDNGGRTPVRRWHPSYVYEKCLFSLISENVNSTNYNWFSEKTMMPILNGHPFICVANQGHHLMLEEYGFRMYDELFDFNFDTESNLHIRIQNIVDQCVMFDRDNYRNLSEQLQKKSLHNKTNLTNTNSILWKKCRQQLLDLIEAYNEL